jgi:hypothetical protein
MKTFGIIIKKKNKADKEGYLHLRITENRKSITKSLNIKIKETYWNPAAGRVKATDKIDYKLINRQLEEILEAAENEDRLIEKKVVDNAKEIESNVIDDTGKDGFLSFFTQQINEISNVGTKKKFRTYLYGFEEYLKSIKKADIAFKDIDKTFVNNLNNYLLNTRKPSTVNRYMKQYKSVLKDAIAEEKVFYKYHPFAKMTFPDPEVKEKYLTKEEVQQLLEFNSTNRHT